MSATAKRETAAILLTSTSLQLEMVDPRQTGVKRRLVLVGFKTGQRNQVGFCVLGRHPPLKHHPTRTRHGEQVAVPGGLGDVAGQGVVWARPLRPHPARRSRPCHLSRRVD